MSTDFHSHISKSSGKHSQNSGGSCNKGGLNVELDAQQAYKGFMVRCPQIFGNIMYMNIIKLLCT